MRTAVYYSNRDLRLQEAPRPQAGPGELLVKVEASGICGSDVMEWYRKPKAPLVLGHEIAGAIEEVGAGVDGFSVGDVVATTHHVPCGQCAYCATGRQSVCRTLKTTSFDPGGFAEYVRLPQINVERGTFTVPDGVSPEAASFVEPLACTIRAQRIAGVGPGKSVAVLGAGISGALQIQLSAIPDVSYMGSWTSDCVACLVGSNVCPSCRVGADPRRGEATTRPRAGTGAYQRASFRY